MSQLWQECSSGEAKKGSQLGCKHQHFLSWKDLGLLEGKKSSTTAQSLIPNSTPGLRHRPMTSLPHLILCLKPFVGHRTDLRSASYCGLGLVSTGLLQRVGIGRRALASDRYQRRQEFNALSGTVPQRAVDNRPFVHCWLADLLITNTPNGEVTVGGAGVW